MPGRIFEADPHQEKYLELCDYKTYVTKLKVLTIEDLEDVLSYMKMAQEGLTEIYQSSAGSKEISDVHTMHRDAYCELILACAKLILLNEDKVINSPKNINIVKNHITQLKQYDQLQEPYRRGLTLLIANFDERISVLQKTADEDDKFLANLIFEREDLIKELMPSNITRKPTLTKS